ncbi:Uncharacterized protein BM_BM584 [Brugia malayi]|uniref:Bm584 n=1 Tax=Brugia malayi TaxID=6279 RepID=A0A4E9FRU4_BRUMA|nr:Uncharacterized protein BM_BM584 [Brugia malayi]
MKERGIYSMSSHTYSTSIVQLQ